jgi:hypothetical protein
MSVYKLNPETPTPKKKNMKPKEVNGIQVPIIPTIEKLEGKCVVLKQKEYDDLVIRSKENRAKEIIVKYTYNLLERSYCSYRIDGDFELKGKLGSQIFNICKKISEKTQNHIDISNDKVRTDTKKYVIKEFSELPWYKRLFFKSEYIN